MPLCDNRKWARVGFDERQETENRSFAIVINKKTPTALEKLAPTAECRDVAEGEVNTQCSPGRAPGGGGGGKCCWCRGGGDGTLVESSGGIKK